MDFDDDRILIVESDQGDVARLCKFFEACGGQIVVAGTVREALELLDPMPTLIVLDLGLPDGDGEEVLRRVRASGRPACVAITSATLEPASLARLYSLKPDLLIPKPIDYARLTLASRTLMPPCASSSFD